MSELPEQRRVFLSYSHDELDTAGVIAEALSNAGIVAYQTDNLPPGENWRDYLNQSVADANTYVILIGDNPTREDRAEWQAVLESHWSDPDKSIIPVVLDDAAVPPAFADWQAIQIHRQPDLDEHAPQEVYGVVSEIFDALAQPPLSAPDLQGEIQQEFLQRLDAIGDLNRRLQLEDDT